MAGAASFSAILQTEFSPTESTWSYNIPNLPALSTATNSIKSLDLVSNPQVRKLELRFIHCDSNRAMSGEPLHNFLHISFANFRVGELADGTWQRCTARDTAAYLARLLKSGITINGTLYSFYGHSSSQLKTRSCYLRRGSKEEVGAHVESLGDFSKINNVAKKAKRIGLLVPDGKHQDIDDIERSGYNFTDGCGLISVSFARRLSRHMPILFQNKRHLPSVLQIRFRGYKGVVTLEPHMPPGCWLQLRKSMCKFTGTSDASFAPYAYGYLNDDITLLLHALGISSECLERKQLQYFQYLQQSLTDPTTAFTIFNALSRPDLAERLVMEGIEAVSPSLRSLIAKECDKMLNKRSEQRCRILVSSSRLLLGVCDPRDTLKPGECFLRVTHDGAPTTILGAEVLVTRNPCLYPGDLRKLKAVNRPELCHLADCIVFSVQGKRPAADQMSGGDLDGDTFFVCWDPDLIPSTLSEAADYPPGKEPLNLQSPTVDSRIGYLSGCTSASLGLVKSLFLEWAIRGGALCSQCQELNRLHSLCVDDNRVQIPERLKKLPRESDGDRDTFILEELHRTAAANSRKTLSMHRAFTEFDSRDLIESLLSEPRACTEFDMIKLVHRWCLKSGSARLADFLPYFDFNALSEDQRHVVLQNLPESFEYPSLIMNALSTSSILGPTELIPFHLNLPQLRWKRIFCSATDRMGNLLEAVEQAFSQFHRKLLVFQVHDRLSVGIYIPLQAARNKDVILGTNARVFAFPHSQHDSGPRRVILLNKAYRLYYDHSRFELYDGQRSNTFIWISRGQNDDSTYRSIKGAANRSRQRQHTITSGVNHDWITSIALNKFSSALQRQIGRVLRQGITAAEIYVISNSDLGSFKALDLWHESVDTMKTHPLFDQTAPPIAVPKISDVDWSLQFEDICAVVKDQNFSSLSQAGVQSSIPQILRFCFDHGEKRLLAGIYRYCLENPRTVVDHSVTPELLQMLVDHLALMPTNSVFLARLSPWAVSLTDDQAKTLQNQASCIVKALVHAAGAMGELVITRFGLFSRN